MEKNNPLSKATLLAVLAHPDDETFGLGGTLALYAERGAAVHLLCATRGEAGDVEAGNMNGFHSVAELRENELRCAAGILGLSGVHFLGYRDSGMPGAPENHHPDALAQAPVDEVAVKIADYIHRLHPQVVLTFDPIGGYRHPDHIAVHRATARAFEWALSPEATQGETPLVDGSLAPYKPQKLYLQTISRRYMRIALRLMPLFGKDPTRWGRNKDIDLVALSRDEFPIHAVINYKPVRHKKEQAAACHVSQGGPGMMRAGLAGWIVRVAGYRETFMRAYPPPIPGKTEYDLFEGIEEVSFVESLAN